MPEIRKLLKDKVFEFGGEPAELPSLLPANLVLELTGESLRQRLFFTNDETGRELCLRPDLTIAAALDFIEAKEKEKSYLIEGKIFLSAGQSVKNENYNIGIEEFSLSQNKKREIFLIEKILEALKIAGIKSGKITLSNGGLLKKIIENAAIDDVWKQYLLFAHKNPNQLNQRLTEAKNHKKTRPLALEKSLSLQSDEEASKTVAEVLGLARLAIGATRSASDIALRLKARAAKALANPLPETQAEILGEIIETSGDIASIKKIEELSKKLSIENSQYFEDLRNNFEAISKLAGEDFKTEFQAAKQGRFEYYDGFMFEISSENLLLAMGGRYDGLINVLSGGKKSALAIGAVIRPSVVTQALNGGKNG